MYGRVRVPMTGFGRVKSATTGYVLGDQLRL